jgi:ATP-dependent RNA helicase DHX57
MQPPRIDVGMWQNSREKSGVTDLIARLQPKTNRAFGSTTLCLCVAHASNLIATRQILAMGFGPIHKFLSEAIDQPTPEMLDSAIKSLKSAGAIHQPSPGADWDMTELGRHLARMPVDVKLGRMLLYAAIFGCIEPVLTIAATMSARSPFVCPFDQRDAANQARESFAKERDMSDHILYVRVFEAWCKVHAQGGAAERAWCQRNFLSIVTLKTIADMRTQFVEILVDAGFLSNKGEAARHASNYNAGHLRLLRSIICAGLYPHVVRVTKPETRYVEHSAGALEQAATAKELKMFTREDGRVFLHPSSINFKRSDFSCPWLVYHAKQVRSKLCAWLWLPKPQSGEALARVLSKLAL